jgi:cephalosporin hydroxylase
MKLIIDSEAQSLTLVEGQTQETHGLYTRAAFEAISRQWLRVGWSLGYYLTFSWFGRPVVQIPEDLIRLQEVVCELRPDVIIETGVYRGGSLLYHATLCHALSRGRVVGIDRLIGPEDRAFVERHFLGSRITLVEGDSASRDVFRRVEQMVRPREVVLVLLDSDHSKGHVAKELGLYSQLVTPGSYIVVADGLMRDLVDVPGGKPEWAADNPLAATEEFLEAHPEFERVQPTWPFKESELTTNVTHWPGGWLRRRV